MPYLCHLLQRHTVVPQPWLCLPLQLPLCCLRRLLRSLPQLLLGLLHLHFPEAQGLHPCRHSCKLLLQGMARLQLSIVHEHSAGSQGGGRQHW